MNNEKKPRVPRDGEAVWRRLHDEYEWRQIPGCPGRLVFSSEADPTALLGEASDCEIRVEHVAGFDPIHIIDFGGDYGLISFEKTEGWVHTLNDTSGFQRKLDDLGIV